MGETKSVQANAPETVSEQELVKKEKGKRVKWGFIWVLISALFTGIGYVGINLEWIAVGDTGVYDILPEGIGGELILSAAVATIQALFITAFVIILWNVITGKAKDYVRCLKKVSMSKYIFYGVIFGGPIAVYGSMLATNYIGAGFCSAIGLLMAVVGAIGAKYINKEKLSKKMILGMIILVVGGIFVIDPSSVIDNIQHPARDGVWIGYIGGIMEAVGFGLEGCFCSMALDANDADNVFATRFSFESMIWVIFGSIILIIAMGVSDFCEMWGDMLGTDTMLVAGLLTGLIMSVGGNTQYKAYALIGVGRTLSLLSLYVPISLVALYIVYGDVPSMWLVVGTLICVAGMFVMYWERGDIEESNRDYGGA